MTDRTATRVILGSAILVVLAIPLSAAAAGRRRIETAAPPTHTQYIPTSASIHGAANAFFHTDLWALNRSFATPLNVTAVFYCFAGPCPGAPVVQSFPVAPRETKLIADVVATLFSQPGTAGAIVLTTQGATDDLAASTRTYTPSLPNPTYGTSIPALHASDARLRAAFVGLGNNGGSLASGFRSNAGVFNPWYEPVHVTFTLTSSAGIVLGTTSADVAPLAATQVNDIFGAAGAGPTVTTNATLIVTASFPVFDFVTVIDNQSGDSVFVPPADDQPVPSLTSLLVNGGFDANVSGWSSYGITLEWSPTDANGNPASGSAKVTNAFPGASSGSPALWQCVAIQPGNVVTATGRSYVSSNQAVHGIVGLGINFSSSPTCASIDIEGYYSQDGDEAFAPDRWNFMQATGIVPAGARAAYLEVQTTKLEAGGSLTAYVDDFTVISSPPPLR